MLKRAIIAFLISIAVFGCKTGNDNTEPKDYFPHVEDGVLYLKSDFNNESYIWESFIFPTNKTTGVH